MLLWITILGHTMQIKINLSNTWSKAYYDSILRCPGVIQWWRFKVVLLQHISSHHWKNKISKIISANKIKKKLTVLTCWSSLPWKHILLFCVFKKSVEEGPKEIWNFKEGIALLWSSEYQWLQLSSVTNNIGRKLDIAKLASLKLCKSIWPATLKTSQVTIS